MTADELCAHIDRLQNVLRHAHGWPALKGARAQVLAVLAQFAGIGSSFYEMAESSAGDQELVRNTLISVLENYKAYVRSGLASSLSVERKAQLDVVNDFLEQAQGLLNTNKVHPAAPIVLVGATLEEFLRTWIDDLELTLDGKKPSLEVYSHVLFTKGVLTKQDVKDITAWGGLRNHAAHGEWDLVADKGRAHIMLEGVNLFMRKYGTH